MKITLTILAALLLLGCCGRCARGEVLDATRVAALKATLGDVQNMGDSAVHVLNAALHAASVSEIPEGTATVTITRQADTFLRRFHARLLRSKVDRAVEASAARIIPSTATAELRSKYIEALSAIKAGKAVTVTP